MNDFWIGFIAWVLIAAGTLGAILPFLPGLPVAWLGLLIYAWYYQFETITVWPLAIFAILIGLTMIVDILAPALAAKGKNASKQAIWGAIIGGFIGVFAMGPAGIIFGPFMGAFAGEILSTNNPKHSFQIALSSMLGLVIGSLFKIIVGASMLIYLLIKMV